MSADEEQRVGVPSPKGSVPETSAEADRQDALVRVPSTKPTRSPQVAAVEDGARRPSVGPRSAAISQIHEEFRMSVGILTDPRSLAEYENAVPGYGSKILDKFFEQVEKEQAHRHAMEREAMAAENAHDQRVLLQGDRGQWMGLVVALAGFTLVGWLALNQHPVIAGIIGSLDLLGLVGAFIYGRKKQADEAIAESRQNLPPPPKNHPELPATRGASTKPLPPVDSEDPAN